MERRADGKAKRQRNTTRAARPAGQSPKGARRGGTAASDETVPAVGPPPPGEGKRGEAGHLGYLLRQAQAANRLRLERALADLGVTPPQFVVLTMLNAYPGLSGAELARVALLTPQTVGVIIGNLERGGAIRKSPHPVHGRMLQWTLTPRGTELLVKCRRRVMAVEQRLAAGLGRGAEATIRRWLARVAAEMQDD